MAGVAATALLWLGLLAAALASGLCFAFSVLVMPGLAAAPPGAAAASMRAINDAVRTLLFAFAFFGPFPLALLAALFAWVGGDGRAAGLALAAACVYAAGTLAVTALVNIPLNQALDRAVAADPPATEAGRIWREFAPRWTAWNHLRTLASILSGALLATALLRG